MKRTLALITAFMILGSPARAQFDEAGFRQALKIKRNVYLAEGSFSGGDRMSSDFKISDLRIAANPAGYDRVVLDFAKLERPPFFLIENDPSSHRINVTVYGKVKIDFSSQTAIQAAKKTKSISSLNFLPIVDADRWMFSINTQGSVKVEVFELTAPARIIIDLKP
jgi:hypothetical protein